MSMRPLWERTFPRVAGFGAHRIADKSAPTVPCELRPPVAGPGASHAASQRGMTLVELILTIVIIGIAATALFSAMASITVRSADPMLRQQSLAIAEGYLERLHLTPYDQLIDIAPEPPKGLDDQPIDELDAYRVQARIETLQLGPSGATVPAKRIRVTVTDPAQGTLTLDGWRTDY